MSLQKQEPEEGATAHLYGQTYEYDSERKQWYYERSFYTHGTGGKPIYHGPEKIYANGESSRLDEIYRESQKERRKPVLCGTYYLWILVLAQVTTFVLGIYITDAVSWTDQKGVYNTPAEMLFSIPLVATTVPVTRKVLRHYWRINERD